MSGDNTKKSKHVFILRAGFSRVLFPKMHLTDELGDQVLREFDDTTPPPHRDMHIINAALCWRGYGPVCKTGDDGSIPSSASKTWWLSSNGRTRGCGPLNASSILVDHPI